MQSLPLQSIILPYFPRGERIEAKHWHGFIVRLAYVWSLIFLALALVIFIDAIASDIVVGGLGALMMLLFGLFGMNLLYRIFLVIMRVDTESKVG